MNTTEPTQRIVAALTKATGLTLGQMALITVGFLAGYFGLQVTFIWVFWAVVLIVVYRVIKDLFPKKASSESAETESLTPD